LGTEPFLFTNFQNCARRSDELPVIRDFILLEREAGEVRKEPRRKLEDPIVGQGGGEDLRYKVPSIKAEKREMSGRGCAHSIKATRRVSSNLELE